MAQPTFTRVPGPPVSGGDLVYRPVSVLAVSGFVLAVLYAVFILVTGAYTFFTSSPLTGLSWTLVLPLAAAALSLAGWWQVRHSEGTRVGLAPARWGMALSLLFGLGYWAYSFANELALRMEAQRFALKWFDKIREEDYNAAFLMTLEPQKREGLRPNDPEDMKRFTMPGESGTSQLDAFEQQRLVRLLRQGGSSSQVEPLGVRSWEYDRGSYKVEQAYRIHTLEGDFDFLLHIRSGVPRPGKPGPRDWFVSNAIVLGTGNPSERGNTAFLWGNDSSHFADRFMGKVARGDTVIAYWDTREPAEREQKLPAYRKRLAKGAKNVFELLPWTTDNAALAAVVLVADRLDAEAGLPGNPKPFLTGALIDASRMPTPDKATEEMRSTLLKFMQDAFRAPGDYVFALSERGQLPMWEEVPDPASRPDMNRLRFRNHYRGIAVDRSSAVDRAHMKAYRYELVVTLLSDAGPISTKRIPRWRIERVEILGGGEPEKPQRGPMVPGAPSPQGPQGPPPQGATPQR
jgi:hypothetical protein